MPAMPRTTLIELVNAVARSVGHPITTDVASSMDEAVLRIAYYANLACTELIYMFNWQFLTKPYNLLFAAEFEGQVERGYDLPPDFKAMVDETHWTRSTQLPAIGPINPQDWQCLVIRDAKVTTRILWRIRGGQIWIKSPSVSEETLKFEYLSKYWAVDGTDGTPKDALEKNNDYHIYPWQLPVLFTRAKWFENEGFDSNGAYADFRTAFNYETGVDKGASSLSLVPYVGYPYLDVARNVPDTGYGSA